MTWLRRKLRCDYCGKKVRTVCQGCGRETACGMCGAPTAALRLFVQELKEKATARGDHAEKGRPHGAALSGR